MYIYIHIQIYEYNICNYICLYVVLYTSSYELFRVQLKAMLLFNIAKAMTLSSEHVLKNIDLNSLRFLHKLPLGYWPFFFLVFV